MTDVFEQYLPENAIKYCKTVSKQYSFKLDLSFNRKSKFGHYKYLPNSKTHIISINRGLSKPLFLITYLHELAHLEVMLQYGRAAKPHGWKWKNAFQKLMLPMLNPTIFSNELLSVLAKHLKNPKASLSADPQLWAILFSSSDKNATYIKDIDEGDEFIFKQRVFKKVKSRRTRALCYESKTGNNYLIPLLAKIEKI